jgi:hypothetical protein
VGRKMEVDLDQYIEVRLDAEDDVVRVVKGNKS